MCEIRMIMLEKTYVFGTKSLPRRAGKAGAGVGQGGCVRPFYPSFQSVRPLPLCEVERHVKVLMQKEVSRGRTRNFE